MVQQMPHNDIYDDDELKIVSLFLTDIGSLLHYDDRSHNLHELYFIDPHWLSDMMSKVVTTKERNPYVRNGILYSKDIPMIFKHEQFPWQYFAQYLTLLDWFEIALPLDNRHLLIPSMLAVNRPSNIDIEDCPTPPHYSRYIMFHSAETPPGFWSRLLSRIMHSVKQVGYALDKTASNGLEEPVRSPHNELLNTMEADSQDTVNRTPPATTPQISDPVPTAKTSIPLNIPQLLPNFPSFLPVRLAKSHNISDIHLVYWRTGLFYSDPDIMFRIKSLLGSMQFRRERKDGVLIVASCNNAGKRSLGSW